MTSVEEWTVKVAGAIGILPPTTNHEHWLRLHRSEAVWCMEIVEYGLLSQEMGWDT